MRCLLCFPSSQKQDIYNNEEKTKIVYPRKKLFFIDDVESADTKGELALATILNSEFRIPNYSKEIVAFGEVGDAVGEVGVGFAVAGDAAAEPRDNMLCVEVIEGAEEWTVGGGQFENDHAAARLEDTQHLAEASLQMDEVADAESASDSIEFAFGEWQVLRVSHFPLSVFHFPLGYGEHFLAEVDAGHCAASFGEADGHIARTAGDIQHTFNF